jgi:hypothetical protein
MHGILRAALRAAYMLQRNDRHARPWRCENYLGCCSRSLGALPGRGQLVYGARHREAALHGK